MTAPGAANRGQQAEGVPAQRRGLVRAVLIALGAGLLVRLVICAAFLSPSQPVPDGHGVLAQNLRAGRGFSLQHDGAFPSVSRAPGFPVFLVPVAHVLDEPPFWARLWATLPGLAAALLLAFRTTRSAAGSAVPVGGLLLAATFPVEPWYAARFFPTGLPALLLVALLLLTDRAMLQHKKKLGVPWFFAAVVLAALVLTRQEMLLVGLLLPVVTWVTTRSRRRSLAALATVAVALVLVAPWSVRCSRLANAFVPVQVLAGFNFWIGEHLATHPLPENDGDFLRESRQLVFENVPEDVRGVGLSYMRWRPADEARVDRVLLARARERIAEAPWSYVRRIVQGVPLYFVGTQTTRKTALAALVSLPLWLLFCVGLWRSRSQRDLRYLCLATGVTVAALCLGHAALYPAMRYSTVLQPLACSFAALSWTRPGRAWPNKEPRALGEAST